jgi:uncharacterized protein YndB with AHSA1/START domain
MISPLNAQSHNGLKVHKVLSIKNSKSIVWDALTNQNELEKWWGKNVKLEARVGGQFYEPWGDGQLAVGKVLNLTNQKSITFTWKEKDWLTSEKTICKFSITRIKNITKLEIEHTGWESFKGLDKQKKIMNGFSKGWDFLLQKLKKHLTNK